MRSTVFRFSVRGDNYEELRRQAEAVVDAFTRAGGETDDNDDGDEFGDDTSPRADYGYEMSVSEIDEEFAEFLYRAEVIVRLRDV